MKESFEAFQRILIADAPLPRWLLPDSAGGPSWARSFMSFLSFLFFFLLFYLFFSFIGLLCLSFSLCCVTMKLMCPLHMCSGPANSIYCFNIVNNTYSFF
jgi:hypothetical protein